MRVLCFNSRTQELLVICCNADMVKTQIYKLTMTTQTYKSQVSTSYMKIPLCWPFPWEGACTLTVPESFVHLLLCSSFSYYVHSGGNSRKSCLFVTSFHLRIYFQHSRSTCSLCKSHTWSFVKFASICKFKHIFFLKLTIGLCSNCQVDTFWWVNFKPNLPLGYPLQLLSTFWCVFPK